MIGITEILHEKDYFEIKTGRNYIAWRISAKTAGHERRQTVPEIRGRNAE